MGAQSSRKGAVRESSSRMTMLLGLIVTGALIATKAASASPSVLDHAGRLRDFGIPLPERMEKKSFASFRFRPKVDWGDPPTKIKNAATKRLRDLDTLEDAYKVTDQLNHFTEERRGQVGHHAQTIPQNEGKTRAKNLLEKAWMRALLKSNFGDRSGPAAFQVSANLWQ